MSANDPRLISADARQASGAADVLGEPMARVVRGTAIASSTTAMEHRPVARRDHKLLQRAANDVADGPDVAPVDGDVASVITSQYRWMIAYSRRLTANGSEAVDLVHIVITRVLSQRTPIAEVANISGWLRTVMFNTFIDLRRRAQWEIPTESASLDQPVPPAEAEPACRHVTMDDLRSVLAALPPHYRVPYEMFTFKEMPYARIAAVLGLSCVTVGTRISRARTRIRRMILERYGA
jgi:RNA polymerase sigma-70 factor (ECF subfamily)